MICQKCGNNFSGKFCPECGTPANLSPAQQRAMNNSASMPTNNSGSPQKGNPPKKNMGCGCLSLIVIIVIAALAFNMCGSDNADKKKSSKSETTEKDAYGWTDDDYAEFITITKQISDEYISNYSAPWGFRDWDFVKFDDTGKVMCSTKYTFKNANEKQTIMCIFTPKGNSFTGHFFSVGGKIYLDDGSCKDTFDKLEKLNK